jgi:integrase
LCGWFVKLLAANRPVHISEVTPAHLIAWPSSWTLGDLTAAIRWGNAKTFFNFCEGQGWISDSPARRIRPTKTAFGGRTAIFSDGQYTAILNAAHGQHRLTAFIELLRWGGTALVDAVQFRSDLLDADGALRYRRHKTGERAVVPLPAHLIALLRNVPLEPDSIGPDQPFRTKGNILKSDVRRWQRHVVLVFKRAGITEVKTENGKTRAPHCHMLRDTCGVSALRRGAALHTVSRMLGHSNVTTTQKAYMPFCRELEDSQIADARAAQTAAAPKPSTGKKVVQIVNSRAVS